MNDGDDLFRALKRHRWLVAACGLLLAAAGFGISAITPPLYEASVRLEIRKPAQRTAWSEQALGASSAQVENLNLYTCAELIKRRGLLAQLAGELESSGAWAVSADGGAGVRSFPWLGESQARAASAPPLEDVRAAARAPRAVDQRVLELSSMIAVRPVHDTRLVDVVVQCGEPELARTIADRLATLVVDDQRLRASESDTAGLAALEGELADARQRMDERETTQRAGVMDTQLLEARRARLTQAMGQLDQDRQHSDDTRQQVATRLARLERYESAPDTALWEPSGNAALDALHQDVLGCARRLAAARTVYKPMHPKLAALEAECAEVRVLERRALPQAIRELRGQVALEASRTSQYRAAMADSERALGGIEATRTALNAVSARAAGDRELEGRLLDRMRDRLLEAPLEPPPVARVDEATVLPDPVRPRKALNVLAGLLTGLLIGTGWALLRGPGLPVLVRPDQIEAALELPVIAVLTENAGEGRP
jgi:succinoglycan biosynthesis transport protein ExoP